MTDEESGLLAAIVEAPDDDAPRLVYADWLQSRGDPRGELIQLQCQLAAVPDDDRRRAIRINENKLLAAHAAEWTRPLHELLIRDDVVGQRREFEHVRGFVEDALISLDCLPHLDALLAAAPLLRTLRITSIGFVGTTIPKPRLPRLESPGLARLRSLELTLGGAGNALADSLAESPILAGLRELRIRASAWGEQVTFFEPGATGLAFDDAGVAKLAAIPHLAQLERLDLENNRVTVVGLQPIAQAAWRLRELVLSHNPLATADAELERLVYALGGDALARLESLALAGSPMSPKQIAAIVGGPHLAQLRELDLEKCSLGAAGADALADAFALPALRRLRLERNSLGDAGAIAIAGCAGLANLTSFEAGHNRIGQKGAQALAASPHFAKLERLTLNEPRWKPATSALFASSPVLANTKVYLAGRLVGRKTKLDATAAAAATAAATAAAKTTSGRSRRKQTAAESEASRAPAADSATSPSSEKDVAATGGRARRKQTATGGAPNPPKPASRARSDAAPSTEPAPKPTSRARRYPAESPAPGDAVTTEVKRRARRSSEP